MITGSKLYFTYDNSAELFKHALYFDLFQLIGQIVIAFTAKK
ncbi:hypothetical protein PEDI_13360 [Persicobacter diffluens]|uniref:Uncharacterized protein n=1 Tax=Persicobacter diffluens TaxID=981 RepID=A0AAN4VX06_9BACT|nr:hypothetical protein PEDI_13360 [Persicobacter diffluens]